MDSLERDNLYSEDELYSEYDEKGNLLYRIPRGERFSIPSNETLERARRIALKNNYDFVLIYAFEH